MPMITFEIKADGSMETHIDGVVGPGCEAVADIIEKLSGKASSVHETAEFRMRAQQKVTQGQS